MRNRLMKSARPTSTWLGGTVGTPSALRASVSTMMMRVKLVSMISSAGATERSVIRMMMRMLWLGLLRASPRLRFTEALPALAAPLAGPDGPAGPVGAVAAFVVLFAAGFSVVAAG